MASVNSTSTAIASPRNARTFAISVSDAENEPALDPIEEALASG